MDTWQAIKQAGKGKYKMNMIMSYELQPEFILEILPGWFYTIDAPEFIPAGSHISMSDGRAQRQAIWREDMKALHPVLTLCGPWLQSKKRGRPITGSAIPVAQRVAKHRASRKAAGLCTCCGQLLLNFQ